MRRSAVSGLAFLGAFLIGGCDAKRDPVSDQSGAPTVATDSAKAAPVVAARKPNIPVPSAFVGIWRLKSIECHDVSGENPGKHWPSPKRLPEVYLEIWENGHWAMYVEGFPMSGEFVVEPLINGPRISLLPTQLHLEIADGRLVNGSEGDLPYGCIRYFERDQP